jgi:5S rRNA maturation endonuclease (ribonuclease M5)
MDNITEKIKSLREAVGVKFVRPDPQLVPKFQDALSRHPQALDYLHKRGFTDETIKHFKVGFDIERTSLAIPIFKGGELVNVKYRFLDSDNARYTSEAGGETWLFNEAGLSPAKKLGGVLIVEGEFDAMSVWQLGIENVISTAAGAQSFGPWLEQIDKLKKIYIAFDNDEAGKKAAEKMAERLGPERCYNVVWPEKDANDFLISGHTQEDLRNLIKAARPFLHSQFKTLGDIIKSLKEEDHTTYVSSFIPSVNMGRGWLSIVSGRSNVGKTSYVLNVASDFVYRGIGVLVMPFERGVESVGQRFLQISNDASLQDMALYQEADWTSLSERAANTPLYFALPAKVDVAEFMLKAKRYFNTEVVIIDHLDYLVRQVQGNKSDDIADTLQRLKRVAEDNGIVLMIVTHIRKTEGPGVEIKKGRRPNIEDLKGSSSLYQDPEVVIMLSETESEDCILVDVLKNKGAMTNKEFHINRSTGKFEPTGF